MVRSDRPKGVEAHDSSTDVAGRPASAPLAAVASAQDDYRHGRVRYVEAGVTLQRAAETGAEEAVANMPFLPGDRVWTDGARPRRVPVRGRHRPAARQPAASWTTSPTTKAPATASIRGSGRARSTFTSGTGAHADFEHRDPGRRGGARTAAASTASTPWAARRASPCYEGEAALEADRAACSVRAGERVHARQRRGREEPQSLRRTRTLDEFASLGRRPRGSPGLRGGPAALPARRRAPLRRRARADGAWYYQSEIGHVWRPYVGVGLAALLRRPLDLDASRVDLGRQRALGLGALPLRPLGLHARAGLVLDSRATPGGRPGCPGPSAATTSAGARWATATSPCSRRTTRRRRPGRARGASTAGGARVRWAYVRRADFAAADLMQKIQPTLRRGPGSPRRSSTSRRPPAATSPRPRPRGRRPARARNAKTRLRGRGRHARAARRSRGHQPVPPRPAGSHRNTEEEAAAAPRGPRARVPRLPARPARSRADGAGGCVPGASPGAASDGRGPRGAPPGVRSPEPAAPRSRSPARPVTPPSSSVHDRAARPSAGAAAAPRGPARPARGARPSAHGDRQQPRAASSAQATGRKDKDH